MLKSTLVGRGTPLNFYDIGERIAVSAQRKYGLLIWHTRRDCWKNDPSLLALGGIPVCGEKAGQIRIIVSILGCRPFALMYSLNCNMQLIDQRFPPLDTAPRVCMPCLISPPPSNRGATRQHNQPTVTTYTCTCLLFRFWTAAEKNDTTVIILLSP